MKKVICLTVQFYFKMIIRVTKPMYSAPYFPDQIRGATESLLSIALKGM